MKNIFLISTLLIILTSSLGCDLVDAVASALVLSNLKICIVNVWMTKMVKDDGTVEMKKVTLLGTACWVESTGFSS